MNELPQPGQLWKVKDLEHIQVQFNKFWQVDEEGNKIRRIWSTELATVGWRFEMVTYESFAKPVPGDIFFITEVVWNQVPYYEKQTLEEARQIYWVTCIVGEDIGIVGCTGNGWEYYLERIA